MNERHDDLQEIIDAALREMAAEEGDGFDPQACNLAEFCRRTGLTRSRARTVRAHGFRALPHGNSGRRAAPGVLAGHTGLVDDLLRKGVTNSQVIFERLLGQGYAGGLTTVKTYIGLATLMWTVPGGAQETGGPYMRDPRHPRHFTDEFKRQIVDLYNAGKPKREIMDEYDLGKSTVERWIKSINATGSPRAACNRTPEQNRILELERENRRLRMEVDVLKQAALIYARK